MVNLCSCNDIYVNPNCGVTHGVIVKKELFYE